jgi:hypothetical protein
MTEGRPKGASTGRLLLGPARRSCPRTRSRWHDRVDGQMHRVDECRLAGAAWAVSGARPAKKLATAVPAAGP